MKPTTSNSRDLRGPARPAATALLAALGGAALALVCPTVGRAQADADKAAVGKDYVLVHKSAYTPAGSPRSPFWPIGWVPTAAVPATQAVAVAAVRPEDFVVTSISMDYPPLAVINKRTYSVGDRVPVSGGGTAPTTAGGEAVMVRQITDGAVVLDYRGKLMRVTTNTPVLSEARKTQ